MLYYLFNYLELKYNLIGAGVFEYISFRSAMAVIFSLVISLVMGGKLIEVLRRKQVGESIRDLGLEGQMEKQGTPTMGGLIILSAIIIPTLLFAKLDNIYVIIILIVTTWLGIIGYVDDYIKVFKKNKQGLAGRFKILGQISVGLIVGVVFLVSDEIKVRDYNNVYTYKHIDSIAIGSPLSVRASHGDRLEGRGEVKGDIIYTHDGPSLKTTIPFIKNNEFNYSWIIDWLGDGYSKLTAVIFVLIVIVIITAVSNGANITDGLDGLATGTSAIIGGTLGLFAYISGNIILAKYLNIMYIPNCGELLIFSGAFIGACVGFLWYNAFPAQVFMGDTGSLALGGIIATMAIIVRKELLIPVLCGVFLIENLSVIIQVFYFKYTKRKYGEGRRVFKMAPLHHHYQRLGFHESKIVSRFWILGIFLALITIITLKLR